MSLANLNDNDVQSQEPTRKPSFVAQQEHPVFADEAYTDKNGNSWSLVIRGVPEVVKAFLNQGSIEVYAEELSEDKWRELLTQYQKESTTQDDAPYEADEMRSLEIYASLQKRVFDGEFFRVSYAVHVPDAGSSTHDHILNAGSDGWVVCMWKANGQPISVTLGGATGVGFKGSLSLPSGSNATWSVTVIKNEGTSYDLSGDSIIPRTG